MANRFLRQVQKLEIWEESKQGTPVSSWLCGVQGQIQDGEHSNKVAGEMGSLWQRARQLASTVHDLLTESFYCDTYYLLQYLPTVGLHPTAMALYTKGNNRL